MKKGLVSLVVLIVLAVSTAAFAQVKEFGPSFKRFTLDIPAGWTAEVDDDGSGTVIMNSQKDTVLSIYVAKHEGILLKNFVDHIAQKLELVNPVIENPDENTMILAGTLNGKNVSAFATKEGDSIVCYISCGNDMKTVNTIIASHIYK